MTQECTVAADIGNTSLALCLRATDQRQSESSLKEFTIPTSDDSWQHRALDWVRDNCGKHSCAWRIASVHGRDAEVLCDGISQAESSATVHCVTRHDVPMTADVDHPDRLGIDRLLVAYAARQRLGAPLVVIDAGSAVTVDCVSDAGDFVGGAILPGLAMQIKSLADGTDGLPRVSPTGKWELPAKNTTAAIQAGVVVGLAGAIDRLIAEYEKAPSFSSKNGQVVMSGGDALALSPQIHHSHQILPNLVCLGLLDLPPL